VAESLLGEYSGKFAERQKCVFIFALRRLEHSDREYFLAHN